jgi:thiol-disulfide isomerase/thioredoxin
MPVAPRRKRQCAIAIPIALFLTAVVIAIGRQATARSRRDVHIVQLDVAAPRFALPSLRDERTPITLSALAGRPVVVNFWASWCAPCREEMKAFEAEHERLAGHVTFVGVDTNDDRNDARAFVAQVGVTYALAFDPEGAVAPRYNAIGLPTTIFIDARGRMLERRLGATSQAELHATIENLLRTSSVRRPSVSVSIRGTSQAGPAHGPDGRYDGL